MGSITLGGNEYVMSGKLSAFDQLHIARKLSPTLPVIDSIIAPENAEKDKTLLSMLMLSHIDDASAEYVVKKCLGTITRRQDTGWAKIQTPDGQMMFADISLTDITTLATMVIVEVLGDFFHTALAGSSSQGSTAVS